ncbi:MAG: chromate resistance protein [Gammaproteobacteria bacterium]|nr:chromate resistance protein [Gammaproteobacteria bacterium]
MASRGKAFRTTWLLFILTLQGQQAAVRMRVWRALKALGTAVLRDGVYLLPNRKEFLGPLQAQSEEVNASGGSAQILEVEARDPRQEVEFRQLFDRTPAYEQLMMDIRGLRKKIGAKDPAAWLPRVTTLRRDYETIALQDFFPGSAREQTREALEDLAAATNALLSPDEPHAAAGRIQRKDRAQYQGRTWATRARPWADRLASAWLIKRFIDPRAKLLWLKKPKDCPKRAVGYDFDGAQFTHLGAKVTFEVLVASFGLESDPALERIGTMIHYLDVGGVPVPEAAGLEAILQGAHRRIADDDELVIETDKLFESLYAYYTASA